MEFRTTFSISPQEPQIDYSSQILLLGSCFVENMGEKLNYFQISNMRNPFGILYHPAAIEIFLKKVAGSESYSDADVFYHNERWHCFDAHSSLSNVNREQLVNDLNQQLATTKDYLQKATHMVITLGTSWGYKLIETGSYVANCHKLPQRRFEKQIMGVEEIVNCLQSVLKGVKVLNPNLIFIFTISPVRHLKDGVMENQLSKAHLITAVHQLLKEDPAQQHYFPSYELMMDDLRDYRFYTEDMIHPNSFAIAYIWEKFSECFISSKAGPVMEEVKAIRQGLAHRPFNVESKAHKTFLKNLERRVENLRLQYPRMEF